MQQQFEQLKRNSLRLEEGMPVIWPKQEKPGTLKVSQVIKTIKDAKAYAFNAKVIAFVDCGQMYVTPYTRESLDIVRNASGFVPREFYVPFSHGDKPLGELGEKWHKLLADIDHLRQAASADDLQARWNQSVVATA